MSGTILSAFSDFVEGTTPAYVQSPTNWVNAAGKRRYQWMRMFDEKKSLAGGEDIRASIVFKDNGSYEHYLPGANHDWVNPQRLQYVKIPWRFDMVHKSWVDQELILNDKIRYGSESAIMEAFVSLNHEKDVISMTSLANGMEESMFAVPDKATMEDADSTSPSPMSLFAWINEDANGLFGENYTGNTWTTVGGITPTAASVDGQFTPGQVTYGNRTDGDADNTIAGLDDLFMTCDWEQPPTLTEYFNDPVLSKQRILTSKQGRKDMMFLTRSGTDSYAAGHQDPGVPDPMMHGVPITYVSELDTAAIYDDGSNGLAVEASADLAGARFYMWNGNFLYPVCHSARFLERDKPSRHHNVPDTWVVPTYCWWNLMCTSRKHQGILSPSADIT